MITLTACFSGVFSRLSLIKAEGFNGYKELILCH